MTERDESMPDPELSPEQEAQVRRLLADARHTEPTPDAVVARLDRVLAGLAEEPAREATVVRLADRRRRAAAMLLGAAASVVGVVWIGQLMTGSGADDAGSSPTAESADSAVAGSAGESEEESSTEGGADRNGALSYDLTQLRKPYALKSEDFSRDADVLQDQAETLSGYFADDGTAPTEAAGSARNGLRRADGRTVCEPGDWGRGQYVAVLYDRAEGWVVLRRPQGDTQVADLFLCGSEVVVRSVTLPYP